MIDLETLFPQKQWHDIEALDLLYHLIYWLRSTSASQIAHQNFFFPVLHSPTDPTCCAIWILKVPYLSIVLSDTMFKLQLCSQPGLWLGSQVTASTKKIDFWPIFFLLKGQWLKREFPLTDFYCIQQDLSFFVLPGEPRLLSQEETASWFQYYTAQFDSKLVKSNSDLERVRS